MIVATSMVGFDVSDIVSGNERILSLCTCDQLLNLLFTGTIKIGRHACRVSRGQIVQTVDGQICCEYCVVAGVKKVP